MRIRMDRTVKTTRVPCMLLIPIAMALLAAAAVGKEKPGGTWTDIQKMQTAAQVEVVSGDSDRLHSRLVIAGEDFLILRIDDADRSFARVTLRGVAVE